jgi:hypothetical protein
LTGCPHPKIHRIQANFSTPNKDTKQIPLRVGLYLDPKLINFIKVPAPKYSNKIDMGDALGKGAQYIVNKAFREVVSIYTTDPELIPKGLDALIIPEIDDIQESDEMNVYKKYGTVTVKIKWTIKDVNNKTIYVNTLTGEATYKHWPTVQREEGYTRAVEDQFTKAYIALTSTNWWQAVKKETN